MKSEVIPRPLSLDWQKGFSRAWKFFSGLKIRRRERELRLRETLPLGDRRFIAIVECRNQEFLVGCTGSSIALLTKLPAGGQREAASPAGEIELTGQFNDRTDG